jgi:hypothetical protein
LTQIVMTYSQPARTIFPIASVITTILTQGVEVQDSLHGQYVLCQNDQAEQRELLDTLGMYSVL